MLRSPRQCYLSFAIKRQIQVDFPYPRDVYRACTVPGAGEAPQGVITKIT